MRTFKKHKIKVCYIITNAVLLPIIQTNNTIKIFQSTMQANE